MVRHGAVGPGTARPGLVRLVRQGRGIYIIRTYKYMLGATRLGAGEVRPVRAGCGRARISTQ